MQTNLSPVTVMNQIKPLLDKLDTIASKLKDNVDTLATASSRPWWDLLSLWRGNTRIESVVGMGVDSYYKVIALKERLAAMHTLAELAVGDVQVSHEDLLHIKAAKDLVVAVKAP